MKNIKFLSVTDVLYIHERILRDTLEDKNLAKHTSIESAINRITDHVYYNNLNNIYEIGALYATAIAKGHCFNNGNKRTAMVSMIVFLLVNGIEVNADNQEIEDKIVELVEDKINQYELSLWIKAQATQ